MEPFFLPSSDFPLPPLLCCSHLFSCACLLQVEKAVDGALTGKVTGGIRDLLGTWAARIYTYLHSLDSLLVLKSTGSSFTDFVRDEYTTLVEVDDRVFSTSVDLSYTYSPFAIRVPTDAKKLAFEVPREVADADAVAGKARVATLDIFATDNSESVQVSHAGSKHDHRFILGVRS